MADFWEPLGADVYGEEGTRRRRRSARELSSRTRSIDVEGRRRRKVGSLSKLAGLTREKQMRKMSV